MTSLRRALVALALAAVAIGVASASLVLTSDHQSDRGLVVALILLAGWGFCGTGLFAWYQRPASNIGPLMTAIGFTWFLQGLQASEDSVIFALGILGSALPYAILIQLLVTFPTGRIETAFQRTLIGLAYLDTTVLQLAWMLFTDPTKEDGCQGCPESPILISGHSTLSGIFDAVQVLVAIPAVAATIIYVFLHWKRSDRRDRRVLSPVLLTGAVAFGFLLVQLVLDQSGLPEATVTVAFIAGVMAFSALPFAFLVGLLRLRIGRDEEIRTALTAENRQLNAELEAKVTELRASRTRIVEAGYEERRRVERDLHDGAQQRLVALTMSLRLVRGRMSSDPEGAAELLDEAMDELGEATRELRELARGIHPAVLSDRGLEAALGGLADRSPVPVEILETPPQRLPKAVESATYFVIAEALTNVARYAGAEAATVRVSREDGLVEVEVHDDGVGGADPAAGTGLRGLEDRVAALEGRLAVESPDGKGTTVLARIPCE
jgi:signal transduction histidine kinase